MSPVAEVAEAASGLWLEEVRALVDAAVTREDVLLALELVTELVDLEKAAAGKGGRTNRLRALEAAVIYLQRAGVHTDLGAGCRLASHALGCADDRQDVAS